MNVHHEEVDFSRLAFITSQFSYCPLVWMYHNRKMNNKINNLHERALRMKFSEKKHDIKHYRNSSGFEIRYIKTVHCGSETIPYLGPKMWDLVPQKIDDSENINIFKS